MLHSRVNYISKYKINLMSIDRFLQRFQWLAPFLTVASSIWLPYQLYLLTLLGFGPDEAARFLFEV